jgi:hypothetical protein
MLKLSKCNKCKIQIFFWNLQSCAAEHKFQMHYMSLVLRQSLMITIARSIKQIEPLFRNNGRATQIIAHYEALKFHLSSHTLKFQ